ncbi:FAD-dependent oxidoreductase [Nocardia sp. BMG51109]|uniref:FAD-dependent oxidoreductase n=1 Tax=Nocardia sp. BMG51109 TaxID=1056816 RepID=UPI000A03C598|nr:FAD-dependent oxidoreductase [Nocardia sp. BMG51109]
MSGVRVAVIGAGISGLVTAKVLRDDGFDVVIFEKGPAIGGVWSESRTYPGLRTNNSRDTYAFSDHPYSRSADMFPTAAQVREYLDSYVRRFGLEPHLRLAAEVVRCPVVVRYSRSSFTPEAIASHRFSIS